MNLADLVSELKRRGTRARTVVDSERMVVTAQVCRPGSARWHETEYTKELINEMVTVEAIAVETVLLNLVELPEEELQLHGWWEWVQQNKAWVLGL